MAEPLKNSFGPEIPAGIAEELQEVQPSFPVEVFMQRVLLDYDELELIARAKRVADEMADFLPRDPEVAVPLITRAIERPAPPHTRAALQGFRYLPYVYYVGAYGLPAFEASMTAQYELTKLFTAEFSIRSFISTYPELTLARLREWTQDPNEHVRRLVSEGTRPRLPWAPRLPEFQADPAPVVSLLELLKDDPSEYVRRSVANNINDISRDNPEVALNLAARWWADADQNRQRLIRHGLRTLIKRGDAAALQILGFTAETPIEVTGLFLEPAEPRIGDRLHCRIELRNPSAEPAGALVDLVMEFARPNGTDARKVFRGAEARLEPDGHRTVRKTISLAQHSSRRHYPGLHRVHVQVNGTILRYAEFDLQDTE